MTGTLYYIPASPRCEIASDIIKFYKLDFNVEIVSFQDFRALNYPVTKAPYLVGEKNFQLFETIAIIEYLFSLVSEEETEKYLGKNAQERAAVLRWNSLITADLMEALTVCVLPLFGKLAYNKKNVEVNFAYASKIADIFESRLADYTYLVTERITISDIFGVLTFAPAFKTIFDKTFAATHPNLVRWFKTVMNNPMISHKFPEMYIVEKKLPYAMPAKEKPASAPQQKAEAKAKAAPSKPDEAEDEPVQEKKPKHPLEALGKPNSFPIDEWKRVYSNQETREAALPWFWDHYDPSEWSLYKVDYKYNDELTLTFMSNNLVGGFFNRLSASTKYLFGCLVVYGENNDNGIIGAFLVRGQEFKPAFDVAPDWESYEYTKLDPTDEADKEFVNNMWAWDKPVTVGSESREIADGKVFK